MKYLILNDFCYLIKKRKFFILLLFVIPLIVTILNAKSSMKSLEIFFLATGTNVNLNELNVLEILMLLFSTFSFLFIYIDIYINISARCAFPLLRGEERKNPRFRGSGGG